ncbi:MAG: hypothetical protein EA420_03440 [Candidatus Competibacteraceae bacterium]|nr:MAG: hypothetical protein EA420_03440 [Candidatus Competibacteraceae bacterium]
MATILKCDRCGSVEHVETIWLDCNETQNCPASGRTEYLNRSVELCRKCLAGYGRRYLKTAKVNANGPLVWPI